MTRWIEASVGLSALAVGTAALIFSIVSLQDQKNARLVEIGVAVLRADPQKEPSAASARKWALDLIDANAGGVRFSVEARQELLNQALTGEFGGGTYDWGYDDKWWNPRTQSRPKSNSDSKPSQ